MNILAIDPGPAESGVMNWNGERAQGTIATNEEILNSTPFFGQMFELAAIEMVAHYGMPVGKEVFETCVWIGRFIERAGDLGLKTQLVYRRDIKLHFCNSARATDANIRYAILDRFGGKDKAIGKKGHYGPLENVKGHLWSALAIALFVQDTLLAPSDNAAPSVTQRKRK